MSKIGYIHYFPYNYYYYGINRKDKHNFAKDDPIDVFNAQRTAIKKRVNGMEFSKKTEDIQKWLNFFASEVATSSQEMQTEVNYAYQEGLNTFLYEIEDGKYSYLIDKINRGSLDIATENSDELKEFDRLTKELVSSSRDAFKEGHGSSMKKIEEKVLLIVLARDFLLNKTAHNYDDVVAKIDGMQKLLKEMLDEREQLDSLGKAGVYNTKMGDADRIIQSTENDIKIFKNFVTKEELDSKKITVNGHAYSFKELVNLLLKDHSLFPLKYFSKEKGVLAEVMTLSALLLGKQKGLQLVNGAVEDSIKSAINSSTIISGMEKTYTQPIIKWNKFIDKNIKMNPLMLKEYGVDGSSIEIEMKNSGTEDKTDFNIQLVSGSSKLNVSQKNYNLYSSGDISLVNGTSLLYLLQDEKSDFVTHYFNVLACNTDTRFNRKVDGKTITMESGLKSLIDEYRRQSYIASALTIIYKAFTGNTYGSSKTSNIFIVYNNKAKNQNESYYVYNIKDIMNKIFTEANGFGNEGLKSYISISTPKGNLENLVLENSFVSSENFGAGVLSRYRGQDNFNYDAAYVRVGNILSEAVKIKLHAGLKKKVILEKKI